MTNELIWKVKECETVEELLALAKENNYPLTEEDAAKIINERSQTGELSDDELDNVSGGGCTIEWNGGIYDVVSSGKKCYTGQYEPGFETSGYIYLNGNKPLNNDHKQLRTTWASFSSKGCCGTCLHLRFQNNIGYCGKSRVRK